VPRRGAPSCDLQPPAAAPHVGARPLPPSPSLQLVSRVRACVRACVMGIACARGWRCEFVRC
jgi:hypothetical protein